MIKPLISQKNINEYEFDTETSVAYIKALQLFHGGHDIDSYLEGVLKKAGLYSNGKLRIFNYKKPKKEGQSIKPDVKFLISLFDNPEKQLWYQPRFKFEHQALEAMLKAYGLRKTSYIIFVMNDVAQGYDFIPDISTPSKLLAKAQSFAKQYKSQEIGEKEKKKVIERTQLLDYRLEQYGLY